MDAQSVVLRLRAEGLSWWAIADTLNEMGVPTRSGRGRWWAMSAYEVLHPGRRRRYQSGYRSVRRPAA